MMRGKSFSRTVAKIGAVLPSVTASMAAIRPPSNVTSRVICSVTL